MRRYEPRRSPRHRGEPLPRTTEKRAYESETGERQDEPQPRTRTDSERAPRLVIPWPNDRPPQKPRSSCRPKGTSGALRTRRRRGRTIGREWPRRDCADGSTLWRPTRASRERARIAYQYRLRRPIVKAMILLSKCHHSECRRLDDNESGERVGGRSTKRTGSQGARGYATRWCSSAYRVSSALFLSCILSRIRAR